MKRLILLTLALVLILAGCTPKTPEPENPFADWLAAAGLDAEETAEELYTAALKEDMLVIYSTSTRMMEVAKSFEAQYPGLIVHVEQLREGELYDKLLENYNTGNFACDLLYSSDGSGVMANEFLPNGIVVKYTPYDIADKILPGNNDDMLMLVGEAPVLMYNDALYLEPPVNNWWELTEEKWRGMVYMANPTKSVTTRIFFMMIENNSDMMAQAYEDLYGRPIELSPGENAGQAFIRRLMENDAVIVNSSDEVAEEVGFPGSRSPSLGIVISSKERLQDLGYDVTNHYDMQPFAGVYAPVSFMMAGGAPNVNAAKLFVRWVIGEADGHGDGYKPYLQSGSWSVRNDVRDDSGIRSEDLNLLRIDAVYMYENQDAFFALWESLLPE